MMFETIASGIKHTGVFPFKHTLPDTCEKTLPGETFDPSSLARKTGLKYIPLYSPARNRPLVGPSDTPVFSINELSKFQARFAQGHDLPDPRYWKWLSMYHPGDTGTQSTSECTSTARDSATIDSPGFSFGEDQEYKC